MERISIFNYEAYYLDYLEGNLSEADTEMLLAFLEEHPECRMEDEELVELDDIAPMTFSGKQSLKQVDEEGPIVMDNVEHFMIADAEGLLTKEKQAELNSVVANDTELEATRRRYNAVYYAPDTSVVYSEKAGLKQRKTIALWPYMTGAVAAAAVVAIMVMTGGNQFTGLDFERSSYALNVPTQETNVVKPVNKTGDNNGESGQASVVYASNGSDVNTSNPIFNETGNMSQREVIRIKNTSIDMSLKPLFRSDSHTPTSPDKNPENPTFADNNSIPAINEGAPLVNPIEPVTAFISEKAKTDIDFKRRKASKEKKGGFLLKIGKFELSKNKH